VLTWVVFHRAGQEGGQRQLFRECPIDGRAPQVERAVRRERPHVENDTHILHIDSVDVLVLLPYALRRAAPPLLLYAKSISFIQFAIAIESLPVSMMAQDQIPNKTTDNIIIYSALIALPGFVYNTQR
jgi:hypothetical protein